MTWAFLLFFWFFEGEPKPPLGAAPVQPLPFSHKTHTTTAALKCADCHKTAATAAEAGLPQAGLCMACHVAVKKDSPAIVKLAEQQKAQQAIAWFRVYQLPRFVTFSHRRHTVKGQVECEACHGDVGSQEVVTKVKSVAMPACQTCHDVRKANNNCDACHDPHPN